MTTFTVSDVFEISGRGKVLVPGFTLTKDSKIKIGDNVIVKTVNAETYNTKIIGASYFSKDKVEYLHIVVGVDLSKAQLMCAIVSLA